MFLMYHIFFVLEKQNHITFNKAIRRLFVIYVRVCKRRFTGEVTRKDGNVFVENKATGQSKSREDDKFNPPQIRSERDVLCRHD